jgi:PEGA domain-containing protein
VPFSGDSVHTILYKHIFEEAPRTSSIRENVPPHLSEAISRAMAKEPSQRFATMEEFATAVWPDQPVTAGKGSRAAATRGPRPKPVVTAETPTEHVSTVAPTTPLPAARPGAKPVARPAERRSRAGLVVGALVVVALGAGGYLVLGRNKPSSGTQTPVNPPQVATQTPPPSAAPVDSSKVTPPAVQTQTKTPTSPPRRHTPPPRTETPPVTTAAEDYGYITVNASGTFAEVYIDNIDVGQTPLINFRVRAGRHTIKLERVGYKTVSETVQVDPNATVRKVYPLIPEG